jgi:hypothetical protein
MAANHFAVNPRRFPQVPNFVTDPTHERYLQHNKSTATR